jgi:hypothetical protein
MSLVQAASRCDGSSFQTTMEAIELGFQKNPPIYNDSQTHVFTFFRTAGSSVGDRVGGYNTSVAGFISAQGAPFGPGAALNSGTFSTIDGTQYDCQIETQLFEGNWWVFACGSWMGYYPTTNSTSVPSDQRINFDLIGSAACGSDWYGEVADPSPTTWSNADMGSGRFAADGWARAAFVRAPFVQLTTSTWDWHSSTTPLGGAGFDNDCYTASQMFSNGGSGWERWFYVGGPGGDNTGCN